MIIAVDFDGTIAEEIWPGPGPIMPEAKRVINGWYDLGHTIIINTCRSGKHEGAAEELLRETGIKFHWINTNDPKLIYQYGMDCRKISADVYIDNRNMGGLPLIEDTDFVDWLEIDRVMREKHKLSKV